MHHTKIKLWSLSGDAAETGLRDTYIAHLRQGFRL